MQRYFRGIQLLEKLIRELTRETSRRSEEIGFEAVAFLSF